MTLGPQGADTRQYLIAIGSPETPRLGPLSRVQDDVERITSIFCSPTQGYQRVLADIIPLASPALTIRGAIYDWFTSPDRRSSDTVLFYFAGHGGDAGRAGNYYLFTSDTDDNQLAKTAINVAAFLQEIYEGEGANQRPQNVLLVIDACYSARGGAQTLAALSRIRESGFLQEGAGLWIVNTADPLTEAGDGTFVSAFEDVLGDPAWASHGRGEFLNPIEVMVGAVNERLQRNGAGQQAEGDVFGSRLSPKFIRNPNHTNKLDGTTLLDEGHWVPKARGVEGLASVGWFFTGRQKALRALTEYLTGTTFIGKALVVTGGPGSGKSALLGRLVMSAHAAKRADMIKAGVLDPLDGTAPPVGSIRAYVHARGLSTEQIAQALARQLSSNLETEDGVLKHIAGVADPVGIVIDALDEAVSPTELESGLLRRLADAPAARLVVGSRRSGELAPVSGAALVVDLDSTTYFERADIAEYLRRLLLESDPPSAYRNPARHDDAHNVAAHIAEQAGFSFLFARVVARALSAEPAIDTRQTDWKKGFRIPDGLNQAFEYDLQRFDSTERRRIVALLVPLAHARGKGLPQKNIWSTVASEISGQLYGNDDIREIKAIAWYYILRDSEDGQVVYRPFHQAFADYLKYLTRDEDTETCFVRALRRAAAPTGGVIGWSRVQDQYTLRYIGAHAAKAGLLADLIQEPEFLTSAPPEAVLPHLHSLGSIAARRIASAYRRVSHQMRAPTMEERVSYFHLAALQEGLTIFAAELAGSALAYSWRADWARWEKAVPGDRARDRIASIGD